MLYAYHPKAEAKYSEGVPNYQLPFKSSMRVIELGGGATPLYPGKWVNADCRWVVGVDLICDFNYPLTMIPSASYDGVYASYILEHISWRKVRGFISECHRLLRPGGVAVFITANLLEQCRALVATPEWNDALICMVFGDNDYPENTHRAGFSPEYATRLFKEAGFYAVRVEPLPGCPTDMLLEARKSRAVVEVRA